MDDPLFDDDMYPADLDFDRRLRDHLAADRPSAPPGQGPERVLAELRPRIVRAGRIRRAQVAATIVAPVVLILGGLLAIPRLASLSDRQATVAGEPAETTMVDDEVENRTTVRVTGTTEPDRSSTDEDGGAGTGGQDPADPGTDDPDGSDGSDATDPSTTADPGVTSTTEPGSTTSMQQTTETSAGTTSIPGSTLVESPCGSIVVLVVDSSVQLIESLPEQGYDVDVKSDGPEVEVSLEGGAGHCELKAKFERGQLVTSSEDEGSEHRSS